MSDAKPSQSIGGLLSQATADIIRDSKRTGVGWLFHPALLLTTADALGRESPQKEVEIQFPNESPQPATCIDWRFSPQSHINFALLRLHQPCQHRKPLPIDLAGKTGSLFTFYEYRLRNVCHAQFVNHSRKARLVLVCDTMFTPMGGLPIFSDDLQSVIGMTCATTSHLRYSKDEPIFNVTPLATIMNLSPQFKALQQKIRHDPSKPVQPLVEEVRLNYGDTYKGNTKDVRSVHSLDDGPDSETHRGDSADQKNSGNENPQRRFPVAEYVRILPNKKYAPIPGGGCLGHIAVDERLQLHFWFSTEEEGITYEGDRPGITPPESVVYPISLLVNVWSETMRISAKPQQITLDATGKSDKACFEIKEIKQRAFDCGEASAFIFVRRLVDPKPDSKLPSELIAVFRSETQVLDGDKRPTSDQTLEHSYLATDWFRFSDEPISGPDLTLYFRSKAGQIQLFTFAGRTGYWGCVGVNEAEFYAETRRCYVEVLKQSIHAAKREAKEKWQAGERTLPLNQETSKKLAQVGGHLYATLFFSSDDSSLYKMGHRLAEEQYDDAAMTIAIDANAKGLIFPWNLLYGPQPPTGHQRVDEGKFWGLRFRLAVRPSGIVRFQSPPSGKPTVGVAYGRHEQAELQSKFIDGLDVNKKVLRAESDKLQGLHEKQFDLLHFYCHGHSDILDVQLSQDLLDEYRTYATKLSGTQGQQARDYLQLVNTSSLSSYIELDGGRVLLDTLKATIRPGRRLARLVLLSMCESAQMTSSGGGFVEFFLKHGAQAVVGTEGPTLWTISREMDKRVLRSLIDDRSTIGEAVTKARRELVSEHALALIYTLYGRGNARLLPVKKAAPPSAI